MAVPPIPAGYHTITPYLVVKDAAKAMDFYKKAFGAEEIMRMPGPSGKIMHAEMRIGDSPFMLGDEHPEYGSVGPTGDARYLSIHLYVPDIDASFKRDTEAGCTVKMPPMDMFWGDRFSKVIDPFGHHWSLATHKEDVTPEECEDAAAAFAQGCPDDK